MGNYRLTVKADSDVLEIARFTIRKFGIRQAEIYKNGLYDCFDALSENPDLGRNASEYAENLKRFIFKSHVVFYRPEIMGISVVRVLHHTMDFERYF